MILEAIVATENAAESLDILQVLVHKARPKFFLFHFKFCTNLLFSFSLSLTFSTRHYTLSHNLSTYNLHRPFLFNSFVHMYLFFNDGCVCMFILHFAGQQIVQESGTGGQGQRQAGRLSTILTNFVTLNAEYIHTVETGYKKVVGNHFFTFLYPVFTISG
jgi:hypothetical protein